MRLRKINIYSLLLSVLIVGISSCSSEIIDKDNTCYIDLGVAVASENQAYAFKMDEGTTLLPTNSIDDNIEIGGRYRVNYATGTQINDSVCEANILDVYQIPTYSLIARQLGTTDSSQERDPVSVNKVWTGGGYVNVTLSYLMSDGNIEHTIQLVRNCFNETNNELTIDLIHYDNGDSALYTNTVTISLLITSIWEYPEAKTVSIRVAESDENGDVILNTYSIAGGKEEE